MRIEAGWRRAALGLGLALVYFGAAKLGLTLAFLQANATAVWPPTGIALAALLIWGWRLWPGVFLGAFSANLLTAGNLWTSLAIASGNTLEALLGCLLVERFANGRGAFLRTPDFFRFVALGGLLAPVVSATAGVSALQAAGMVAPASFKDVWFTWWLGDAGGALLVAPLILLWPGKEFLKVRPFHILEGAGLAALTFLTAWLLFGGVTQISYRNDPVQFLFIPIFIWAAARFGPFGASLTMLAVSIFAIQGTLHGFGPFQGATENQSLLFLQGFMSMTVVAILALACGTQERRRAEEALRWSHSDLQLKVLERTEHLVKANRELEKQFKEKEGLAGELMESNEKFHLLSEATGEGVVLVVEGIVVGANSTFCRIFGYEPQEVIGMKPDGFVVPEFREMVRGHVSRGSDETYRVTGLRKDGAKIDLEVSGRTVHQKGEAVRVTAIRDITERNRRDEELRRLALLVETSSDFICLASLDGHMTYVNGAGRRLVGLGPAEDVTSLFHQDFIQPGDVPRLMEEVIGSISSKGNWEGEFDLRHFRTGDSLPFHFTAVLVRDPLTGEPRAMAGIGRDISRQKRSEALLEEKGKELSKSERYFRSLIENALDIVTILDARGTILFQSPSITRLLGYAQEELLGVNAFALVHPEDVAGVEEAFASLLEKEGNIRTVKFRFRHRDGSWRVLESLGTNLLGDGAIRGIVVNSRDVTGEEEALKELEVREERFRLMVENVQEYAIFFLDTAGRVMTWNPGAQRIQGYAAEEVIGTHFSRFYTPQDRKIGRPERLLKEVIEKGRVEDEGLRVRKDGTQFWGNTILTALRDEKGRLRGIAKITRDITQRKRMEELARSNQDLEQFATVASHDLQEPLRMITSFVQLLARRYQGRLDPEADQYIHEVVDGASRMRALILDLLAYSRLDSTGSPSGQVDSNLALGQALQNLAPSLRESEAKVEAGKLPLIRGDLNQVVQLFQNLLGNSIKFRGKDPLRIKVEAQRKDGDWVFCVRDNGIGIDPKYSGQIFDVFKRLHSRVEYPGTGIGLAICKKVVGRHGGRIWVESQPGRGASIYWTIPVLQEANLEIRP